MKKRFIATGMLIAHIAILVKVMVFKDLPVIRIGALMFNFGGTHEGPANLLPFKTILPYLLGEKGLVIAGINLVGNVVLLVPIGFLVPFVVANMTSKKSLALAVAAGFAIEGMQALLHVGIFDIDDVILNGLGVMVGYWAFTMLAKMERSMKLKTLIITSVIVVVSATAFYSFTMSQKRQAPVSLRPGAESGQSENFDKRKTEIPQGEDPCGGTGGTGQIVGVGNNSITIKQHDSTRLIINFTTQTIIRNSAGAVSKADLKIGDRVTVVVDLTNDGTGTATTVVVCNGASRQAAK